MPSKHIDMFLVAPVQYGKGDSCELKVIISPKYPSLRGVYLIVILTISQTMAASSALLETGNGSIDCKLFTEVLINHLNCLGMLLAGSDFKVSMSWS